MLENLLNTKVIQVMEQAKDWREAVTISCRPLIGNGSTELRYVDAIYRSHDTIGLYYVIGPGIAMPHACPEEGANELLLALTLIPSGVNFDTDENDPMELLIVLTTTDSTNHIEATSQLAKLLDNEKNIQAILTTETAQDISSVITRYQSRGTFMKITVVCGNDLDTSLMMEINIKSILKDLSISAGVDHVDLDSAKETPSDIYVDTKDIAEQLVAQSVAGKIVALENMIDKEATRECLSTILNELGAL